MGGLTDKKAHIKTCDFLRNPEIKTIDFNQKIYIYITICISL